MKDVTIHSFNPSIQLAWYPGCKTYKNQQQLYCAKMITWSLSHHPKKCLSSANPYLKNVPRFCYTENWELVKQHLQKDLPSDLVSTEQKSTAQPMHTSTFTTISFFISICTDWKRQKIWWKNEYWTIYMNMILWL